jgi:hypothetical protein
VIAGAKLHVIAMSLARQAYSLYYIHESESGEGDGSYSGDDGSINSNPPRPGQPLVSLKENEVFDRMDGPPLRSLAVDSKRCSTTDNCDATCADEDFSQRMRSHRDSLAGSRRAPHRSFETIEPETVTGAGGVGMHQVSPGINTAVVAKLLCM